MKTAARRLRQIAGSVSGGQMLVLILVVVAAAAMVVQQKNALASAAQATAQEQADASVAELGRTFSTWRTELLVAAANPALQEWYRQPHDRSQLRPEVDQGLLTLHTVDPGLFDEVCLIDVDGQEQARHVHGQASPVDELSPDESVNPFFAPTLELEAAHVHRNTPYISPDSHRWVISNSTPLYVDDELVAMVHLEANLDRLRLQVADASTADRVIQIVDPEQGTVITDSRLTDPLGARPLVPASQQPLPATWQRASASLPATPGNDLQWRVDVATRSDAIWGAGLLLRLSALLLLGCAALMMLGVHAGIRRADDLDGAQVSQPSEAVAASRTDRDLLPASRTPPGPQIP